MTPRRLGIYTCFRCGSCQLAESSFQNGYCVFIEHIIVLDLGYFDEVVADDGRLTAIIDEQILRMDARECARPCGWAGGGMECDSGSGISAGAGPDPHENQASGNRQKISFCSCFEGWECLLSEGIVHGASAFPYGSEG